MKLKEAIEKSLKDFFQKERPEVISTLRKEAKKHSVLVHFCEIDSLDVWNWDDDNGVKITEEEIRDEAYYLYIRYKTNLPINESEIEDKPSKEELDEKFNSDIVCFFDHKMGGEEKVNKFYQKIQKEEIKEILKEFKCSKAGDGTFWVSLKTK
jgi:hypothetical protein